MSGGNGARHRTMRPEGNCFSRWPNLRQGNGRCGHYGEGQQTKLVHHTWCPFPPSFLFGGEPEPGNFFDIFVFFYGDIAAYGRRKGELIRGEKYQIASRGHVAVLSCRCGHLERTAKCIFK